MINSATLIRKLRRLTSEKLLPFEQEKLLERLHQRFDNKENPSELAALSALISAREILEQKSLHSFNEALLVLDNLKKPLAGVMENLAEDMDKLRLQIEKTQEKLGIAETAEEKTNIPTETKKTKKTKKTENSIYKRDKLPPINSEGYYAAVEAQLMQAKNELLSQKYKEYFLDGDADANLSYRHLQKAQPGSDICLLDLANVLRNIEANVKKAVENSMPAANKSNLKKLEEHFKELGSQRSSQMVCDAFNQYQQRVKLLKSLKCLNKSMEDAHLEREKIKLFEARLSELSMKLRDNAVFIEGISRMKDDYSALVRDFDKKIKPFSEIMSNYPELGLNYPAICVANLDDNYMPAIEGMLDAKAMTKMLQDYLEKVKDGDPNPLRCIQSDSLKLCLEHTMVNRLRGVKKFLQQALNLILNIFHGGCNGIRKILHVETLPPRVPVTFFETAARKHLRQATHYVDHSLEQMTYTTPGSTFKN